MVDDGDDDDDDFFYFININGTDNSRDIRLLSLHDPIHGPIILTYSTSGFFLNCLPRWVF